MIYPRMLPENRFQQLRNLGILAFPLFFTACTFEPDENYVTISDKPTVTMVSTELSIHNLLTLPDTFDVYARSSYLQAKMDFENEDVVNLEVLIDGKHKQSITADSIKFLLEAPDYPDGYHNITVKARTNSGTGSLADNSGAEILTWERSWTFNIKRFDPPAINLTNVGPEDGRLVIEWEASNVKSEKLIQIEYTSPNQFPIKWSHLVVDPTQTRLVDDTFVEGGLKVTLINQSIDPDIPSPSNVHTSSFTFPTIVENSLDGHGNVSLKWTRSLFHRNVAKYTVEYDDHLIRNQSGADTVLSTDKIPFWGLKQVVFRTVAKKLLRYYQDTVKLRVATSITVGENIGHRMSEVIHSPLNPSLGFSIDNTTRKIHVLEGDVPTHSFDMDTLTLHIPRKDLAVSNDGAYLYLGYNGRVIRMDRSGNGEVVLDSRTAYGQAMDISHLSLGADRYLCFDNKKYASTLNVTSYLFDLQTNQPLWERYDSDTYYNLDNFISQTPDGKYLVLHDNGDVNFFTLQDGLMVSTRTIELSTNNPLAIFFNTALDNKLLLANSYRIAVYDPATGELTERLIPDQTVNYGVTFCYDPVKGILGYRLEGHFYVIDPITATVLRKVPVETYTTRFTLYDGNLYSGLWKCDLHLD